MKSTNFRRVVSAKKQGEGAGQGRDDQGASAVWMKF